MLRGLHNWLTERLQLRETICAALLILLPLLPGCPGFIPLPLVPLGGPGPPECPDMPSLTWMVPDTQGQANLLGQRQIFVEGMYAPDAQIIGPQRYAKDCWTNAGLNLNTLREAVSRASAQAGWVEFNVPQGDRFMLRFEVNRQELSFLIIPLRKYSAIVVISYTLSRGDREEPIWKEQISTERVIEYGFAASFGLAAAPPHVGSSSPHTAVIEGAVTDNLRLLVKKFKGAAEHYSGATR